MATQLLTEKYAESLDGVLGCQDRIVFTGRLAELCYAKGVTHDLHAHGIRIAFVNETVYGTSGPTGVRTARCAWRAHRARAQESVPDVGGHRIQFDTVPGAPAIARPFASHAQLATP